jgi:hypothetical protein
MRRTTAALALVLLCGACDFSTGVVPPPTTGTAPKANAAAKPPGPGPGGLDRPRFQATVERIPPQVRARMTSWHRGCPVAPRDLRLVTLTHWGFDGKAHLGRLMVAHRQAKNIVRAMHRLYDIGFPIRRMRLIDAYGSDDHRSMAANNTSAFNCRFVSGTTRWSEHAYGRAIDINPVQNPAVEGSHVSPPAGRPYADRSRRARGMVHAGDAVVRAFAAVGWEWGGHWRPFIDYQHFSATGR